MHRYGEAIKADVSRRMSPPHKQSVAVSRWRQAPQDANAKPLLTMAEQKELERLRAQDQRRRTRKSDQRRAPAEGDRADRRSE
jgi:hypothetical protein